MDFMCKETRLKEDCRFFPTLLLCRKNGRSKPLPYGWRGTFVPMPYHLIGAAGSYLPLRRNGEYCCGRKVKYKKRHSRAGMPYFYVYQTVSL